MVNLRKFATAGTAALAMLSSATASRADSKSGFYLHYQPGVCVEYLSLNESARDTSGYLEAIRASGPAADGQVRTQTFSTNNGSALSFGKRSATRVADGYMLTSATAQGNVVVEHFVREPVRVINASIVALSASVSRNRARSDVATYRSQLRTYSAISADDTAQLAKAESAIEAAAAQVNEAQRTADRLSGVARASRADANAALDKSGVSERQNRERIDAMKTADDAERDVVEAQRAADVAEATLGSARADVVRLRVHIAAIAERARELAARLASGTALAGR